MHKARLPRPDEIEDLNQLTAICFGFHPGPSRARTGGRSPRVPKGARIVVADGKPVSHLRIAYNYLSVQGARVKVASFGGVCTHPDYRGRGIATQLLESCVRETVEAKALLLFISGMRGLYRRAHAVPAGPVWRVSVRPGCPGTVPGAVSVRGAGAEDWRSVALLHQAERVRFVRGASFYARVVSRGSHRGIWLVEHEGRPLAYLCLSRIWGLPRDKPVRALAEYAGSRVALLEGLAALLPAAGLSEVQASFPQFDEELTYLCRQHGLGLTPDTIPGHTIRLLNLPGLMKALRPYVLSRLSGAEARGLRFGQNEEGCRFGFGTETSEASPAHAAAIVLGGHRAPRVAGELGAILSRLFPIPVPLPGLNYV